eukprot:479096-Amphidinium_carterae.1
MTEKKYKNPPTTLNTINNNTRKCAFKALRHWSAKLTCQGLSLLISVRLHEAEERLASRDARISGLLAEAEAVTLFHIISRVRMTSTICPPASHGTAIPFK